jgi:hypothetical protein
VLLLLQERCSELRALLAYFHINLLLDSQLLANTFCAAAAAAAGGLP